MADQLLNLEAVLQDKLIEVADYQRPYAWGEKQLQDLWQDLDLIGTDRHYAGTLVLQQTDRGKRTQDGKDLTVYEVVDGQQRLTTCIILLEQLARAMEAYTGLGFDDFDDARRDVARLVRVNVGGVATARLRLGIDLRDFFERSILGASPVDKSEIVAGEQRLLLASNFFRESISALLEGSAADEAVRRLTELRARITYRLRFLVYPVESSAEVGVLFETLNDRGQSLSELEKVKNYLLYLARQMDGEVRDRLAETINHAWSEIFTNTASFGIEDDALLQAHWVITEDPNSRTWERSASIKKKFPRARYVPKSGRLAGGEDASEEVSGQTAIQLYDEVTEYVETLRRCSMFIREIADPNAQFLAFDDPSTRARVRRQGAAFVRTGSVANLRPLLLAARLKYPNNGLLYLQLLELAEKFSARAYLICAVRTNAGRSPLRNLARRLYLGQDPDQVVEELQALLWGLAPDDAVRAAFGPAIDWYHRAGHKYVLYEFELAEVRSGSELPAFGDLTSAGNKTTEHVLPQTPAEDSHWWESFSRDQHAALLNTIGNLVLTRDNSVYGRRDFNDAADDDGSLLPGKRGRAGQEEPRCYFSTSALARERQIAQRYDVWDPSTIEARREEIADWAIERWHLEAPPEPYAESDVDDDADEPVVTTS